MFRPARNAFRSPKHSVLVQLELLGLGDLAQLDVVRLRAGEVLHGGTKRRGLHDAQVHLQPAGEQHRRPGLSLRRDVGDFAEFSKSRDDGGRIPAADHDVEVPDGFLAPAKAAGHVDLVDAAPPASLEVLHDCPGVLLGFVQHHALLCRRCGVGDALANLLKELGAETGKLPDVSLFQRVLEIGDAVHLQLLVKQLDALGAKAGNAQQLEQARWQRRHELLALRQGARVDQRRDLFRDAAPDARQVGQVELPSGHKLGDGIGMIRDRARGVAVGPDLERIARRDLE